MFTVVGCRECDALWIVADRPETTGCPRCGRRHRFERLRALAEADDEATARRARAAILADRQDAEVPGDAGSSVEDRDPAVSDEEYLGAAGLDADAVEAAASPGGTDRPSGPRAVVEHALRSLDEPSLEDIERVAAEHGVTPDRAAATLERLVRAGAATERDGVYRLL